MGVSKNHIHTERENEYAAIAKVLAHPARIAILAFAAKSKECLCKDIAERIKLSQPTTSQHLQVIQKLRVLETKFRDGKMYYSLNMEAFSNFKMKISEYFAIVEKRTENST